MTNPGMTTMAGLVAVFGLLTGCMTPAEKRQMKNEMFSLQTRVMTLESAHVEGKQENATVGEAQKRRLATTSSEVERLQSEMMRMKGEIDALRIGVTTGNMPGQEPSSNSLGMQIKDLQDRLTVLEEQQVELAAAVAKVGSKTPAAKGAEVKKGDRAETKKGDRNSMTTVAQLSEAFEKKRFKHITEDAPAVIKSAKGKDKEEASFLYAESLFKVGRLRESALQFNEFLESKPAAKYLPTAKMRMGDSFRHMGDNATAKIYYEELVEKYPQSPEAEKAKERLAELAGGGSQAKPATGGDSQGSAGSRGPSPRRVARGSPEAKSR